MPSPLLYWPELDHLEAFKSLRDTDTAGLDSMGFPETDKPWPMLLGGWLDSNLCSTLSQKVRLESLFYVISGQTGFGKSWSQAQFGDHGIYRAWKRFSTKWAHHPLYASFKIHLISLKRVQKVQTRHNKQGVHVYHQASWSLPQMPAGSAALKNLYSRPSN